MSQNDTNQQTPVNECAMVVDPVITWLEQCRDFMGATPEAKALAQRAIDRIRPPAVDPWTVISAVVDELGELRTNDHGAIISDRPHHPPASADDAGYYGGYLVAESVTRRNAIAMSFLPQLLVVAREHPNGRAILKQLAETLQSPAPSWPLVRDRLEGTLQLARLAHAFQHGGAGFHHESDPFYIVSQLLERIAQALLENTVSKAAEDVEAWLEGKRAARRQGTAS